MMRLWEHKFKQSTWSWRLAGFCTRRVCLSSGDGIYLPERDFRVTNTMPLLILKFKESLEDIWQNCKNKNTQVGKSMQLQDTRSCIKILNTWGWSHGWFRNSTQLKSSWFCTGVSISHQLLVPSPEHRNKAEFMYKNKRGWAQSFRHHVEISHKAEGTSKGQMREVNKNYLTTVETIVRKQNMQFSLDSATFLGKINNLILSYNWIQEAKLPNST